jgi:hypothetical protein
MRKAQKLEEKWERMAPVEMKGLSEIIERNFIES